MDIMQLLEETEGAQITNLEITAWLYYDVSRQEWVVMNGDKEVFRGNEYDAVEKFRDY